MTLGRDTDVQVVVRLRDEMSREMNGLTNNIKRNRQQIGVALAGIAAAGILAVKSFVTLANEQREAENVLIQVIDNAGQSYDVHRDKIKDVTAAMQRKTNFGDEEQLRVLPQLIAATGSVDAGLDALAITADLATINHQSLMGAARALAPVLGGVTNTIRGTNINFDATATTAERLAILLDGPFRGAAEANQNAFTQLGNDLGDVKEKLGAALLPTLEVIAKRLGQVARAVDGWIERNQGLTRVLAPVVLGAIALATFLGPILILLPLLVTGFGLMAAGLTAVTRGFVTAGGAATFFQKRVATLGVLGAAVAFSSMGGPGKIKDYGWGVLKPGGLQKALLPSFSTSTPAIPGMATSTPSGINVYVPSSSLIVMQDEKSMRQFASILERQLHRVQRTRNRLA